MLQTALRREIGLSEITIVDIATPQLSPRTLDCEAEPTEVPGMTKIPTSSPTYFPSKAPATSAAGAGKIISLVTIFDAKSGFECDK